jgi:hypothetical protein
MIFTAIPSPKSYIHLTGSIDYSPIVVDGKVEVLEDGNYVYEVTGIPDGDPDDHLYPSAKKPSRITFSKQPIKVRTCAVYNTVQGY